LYLFCVRFPAVFFFDTNDFALLIIRDKKVGFFDGFMESNDIADSGDRIIAAENPVLVRGIDILDSSAIS
jgi:hypothetical protein